MLWRDREGGGGENRFRLSRSLSLPSDIVTLTGSARLLLSNLSDAVLVGVVVTERAIELDPDSPGDTLVSRRVLVMWLNADGDYASMVIPAVPTSAFAIVGPYAGVYVPADYFDDLTTFLTDNSAIDRQGIPINGACLGGMLIV